MKRLYYLADNMDVVDSIADTLHRNGTSDWDFHVLSRDDAGLYRHHLHSATPLHQRDVIRFGERGGIVGFLAGLLAAGLVVLMSPYFDPHRLVAFGVVTVLVTLFGIWAGGLIGLGIENQKISRFHTEIEAGQHLLMIDVPRDKQDYIRKLMQLFPVVAGGEDSSMVLPFELKKA